MTTIPAEELQGLEEVVFKFDLFTSESWDDEWAYIKLKDQNGNQIAHRDIQSRHFHPNADVDLNRCHGINEGMGIWHIELRAAYQETMGPLTLEITNTLNEHNGNEALGVGNIEFSVSESYTQSGCGNQVALPIDAAPVCEVES